MNTNYYVFGTFKKLILNINKCYCYRGQGSLVASSDVLHNDSPSSSSKEHEHRSSCEDSGTLSILTCYFTCVMRRYLSPEHALTDFKWHRTGPLHVKLVNKAHHVGVVGNMTVQRSRFEPGTSRFTVQRSTAVPHGPHVCINRCTYTYSNSP